MATDVPATDAVTLAQALDQRSIALRQQLPDREAAIRRSGDLLGVTGNVDPSYTDEMLATLAEFGPYIVIAPGVALAHSRPSPGVHAVAFSILTLDPPIPFGHEENDPVRLVVGMAAPDADVHVEALRELAELLGEEDVREGLMAASSVDDVLELVRRPANGAAGAQEGKATIE